MPTLRQSVLIRADQDAVRAALLDATSLATILGRPCEASPEVGAPFSLWEGIVTGHNAKISDTEIVQTWRLHIEAWPEGHDSNLVIQLRDEGDGTRVALAQSSIPAGCALAVEEHWRDHVWPGIKAILEKPERHEVGRRGWLAWPR